MHEGEFRAPRQFNLLSYSDKCLQRVRWAVPVARTLGTVWSGVQARLGVLEAVRVAPLRDWVGASGRGVGAQGHGQGASLFLCELQDVVLYMWVFDEDAFLSDDNFGLGFRLARARISLCPHRCLTYFKLSRGCRST